MKLLPSRLSEHSSPYLTLQGPAEEKNRLLALHHPTLEYVVGCRILPSPAMKGYAGKIRGAAKEGVLQEPLPLVIKKYKSTPYYIAKYFVALDLESAAPQAVKDWAKAIGGVFAGTSSVAMEGSRFTSW